MTAVSPQPNTLISKHSHGYNLAMAKFAGADFYAYRWHPNPKSWRTEISIVCDGIEKPLLAPNGYEHHSIEDPRFFAHKNNLWISMTVSRSRVSGQNCDPCVMGYGVLVEEKDYWRLSNWIEPKHVGNTWSKQTKNLVFNSSKQGLLMTWETYPAHVVHLLDDKGLITTGWRTESPKCAFGNYRGGTQSFPYQGNRLRFCHAVQNNPKATQYWGYSLACYVFQPEPPFRILQVSQQPILVGNELYTPDCPHWKPRICIPYGAIEIDGGWRLSLGLNDCECATIDLTEDDLNL